MASITYNSCLGDALKANINFSADTFYGMLVTSAYVPNPDTHTRRSDVTNEVTGSGYTAGGKAVTVTLSALDTANDEWTINVAAVSWAGSSAVARGMVVYKRRGGAATADELIFFQDGGADFLASDGLLASTIKLKNMSVA